MSLCGKLVSEYSTAQAQITAGTINARQILSHSVVYLLSPNNLENN